MPPRLLILLAALTLGLLGAGLAQAETVQERNVRITFSGGFTPHTLPRDRPAPVTVDIRGAIGTADGTHPPPVQRVVIALNRHGRLSTAGLPACTSPLLQSTSSETALARCRSALVGRGQFGAEVQFASTEPVLANGRLLAFFGRTNGKPAVLLHLFLTTPVRTTFVLPLLISNSSKGKFGTTLSARIPRLAGGLGSVTEIDLAIGREYTYRGQSRSFISASCPAPAGFPGAVFSFARGSFFFAEGTKIDATLTRDCRVR